MRILALLLLTFSISLAHAADNKPAEFKPVPQPPALDPTEAVDEPQITIIKQSEQTVEEFRANGKLYMIKITPKHGVPYYLIDDRGDGKFARQESLDSGLRVPTWIIHKF
ncbi:MAG: DUF2782 domain-containing protein [Gallionellaceae bacterium]|jgi:hypothetical protein